MYSSFFKQENWDTHELENNRSSYSSQPFILCLGTMKSPSSYNVVIENIFIPCGESISHAFQALYCSFYCFRLQYPKRIYSLYRLFDDFVFKLTSRNKDIVMASCLAFEARVKEINLPLLEQIENSDDLLILIHYYFFLNKTFFCYFYCIP